MELAALAKQIPCIPSNELLCIAYFSLCLIVPVPDKMRRFNEENWQRSLARTSSVFGGSRDTVLEGRTRIKMSVKFMRQYIS